MLLPDAAALGGVSAAADANCKRVVVAHVGRILSLDRAFAN